MEKRHSQPDTTRQCKYIDILCNLFIFHFQVRMLADPSGNFVKALDLGTTLPPLGGFRSKRFSMVINDSKIEQLNVEPDGTGLSCSLADKLKVKN